MDHTRFFPLQQIMKSLKASIISCVFLYMSWKMLARQALIVSKILTYITQSPEDSQHNSCLDILTFVYCCTPAPSPKDSSLKISLAEQAWTWCFRSHWPSRMWLWTSPERSGTSCTLLRRTSTEMWCWRTIGIWSHLVWVVVSL